MEVTPDFRTQLDEVRQEGTRRIFRPLTAGRYRLSIQASEQHLSHPRSLIPLEDYDRWEVTVYAADGSWVTPRTHPRLFQDPLWSRYWIEDTPGDATIGQFVPTEIVQTFYDLLVLGSTLYEEATGTEP